MSKYDFILDGIRFSHSSVKTYETCPYSFKLTYVDNLRKEGEDNFYSDFGNLVHECMEKYFLGELEFYQLSQYYRDNYDRIITHDAPPENYGLGDKYREQGQKFFDNFSFNKDDYEVKLVEGKIDFPLDSYTMTARPDLVLQEKETGKMIMFDYKTATPYWTNKAGKEQEDKKKVEGYAKQMFIYTYALRNYKQMPIDEIRLWYPRLEKIVTTVWTQEAEDEAMEWLKNLVVSIKADEQFMYDNSNSYYCNNICSVRKFCEYR
jgi:hypothetical protein